MKINKKKGILFWITGLSGSGKTTIANYLESVKGFKSFNLIKGEANETFTLYASHSIWASKHAFTNWTKSEAFRKAHKNAGSAKNIYIGHPKFEGFEVII